MRDKQRPWLDFDGSLELARQEKAARDEKGRVRSRRSKKLAIFLMVFYGGFGLHRYYLYDSKIGRKLIKFYGLLTVITMFLMLIFGAESKTANALIFLIVLHIAIKEYEYVSKTVDQINKDIAL